MLEYKKLSFNTLENNNTALTRCKVSKYDFILILLINVFILFYSLSFQYLQILILLAMIIYVCKIKVMNISKLLVLSYLCVSFICLIDLRQSQDFEKFFVFIIFFAIIVDVSAYLVGNTP